MHTEYIVRNMPMPKPRESTRIAERRQEVSRRYILGESQTTIARALHITQAMVSKDLKAVREAWLASAVRDFDALKAEQLAKIDQVEQAAWSAFTRSQQDTESTVQEKHGGKLKVSLRIDPHVGDPRWLQIVLDCVSRRSDLLGLNAPQRYSIDFDKLSESQLERLARGEPVASVLAETAPVTMAEA